MRRGIQKKGEILARDLNHAASMIVGSHLSGQDFNAEKFIHYLADGVFREIDSHTLLIYVSELTHETLNRLKKEYTDKDRKRTIYPWKVYVDKIRECEDYLMKRPPGMTFFTYQESAALVQVRSQRSKREDDMDRT